MSHSTLYAVYRTKATALAEYRNGHGTAPMIWGLLSERFLGVDFHMSMSGDVEPLWKLAYDKSVSEHLRITHAFTFDQGMCRLANTERLIPSLRKADADIIESKEGRWSHFNQIANSLEDHKSDHRMIGYGLGCTSVSDPWEFRDASDYAPWDIFEEIIDR